MRAHFRCRRTGQDKESDERLTSVEKVAQRKDEINATLGKLDNIIATWDAVFKETRDRLEASRSSKAAELALFRNATKALKHAVRLFKSGKVAENDDDEEDSAYEASGYAAVRKMFAEWFKRPRTFRMCNFILGRSPSDLIGMGGITVVAIVGYTLAASWPSRNLTSKMILSNCLHSTTGLSSAPDSRPSSFPWQPLFQSSTHRPLSPKR